MIKKDIKILIIEDEALIAKAIKSDLKKMGYNLIDIAISYNKAMYKIRTRKPNLILLDINLKDVYTGVDIANEKEVLNKIPIIYLTGCKDEEVIEDVIATNPKAYISKPIKYNELKIAISIALISYKKSDIVDIGHNFIYDFKNRNLFLNKKPIKLSKNEKILLERLIKAKGKAVSYIDLEFEIWAYETKSDNALRALIRNLRKKLNFKMIENILSFGYKLNLLEKEM